MIITVKRLRNNGDTTIGEMYIDDILVCDTLEDQPNEKKVYAETRIPAGTYTIKFRKEGKFHQAYSERFKEFHVGMLHITNIPGFEYVLIHVGNTDKDTAGCLLVGVAKGWALEKSTDTYKKIYKEIAAALLSGEEVKIKYIDMDGK